MKTLYLDLSMGAAGDMLAAALIGLLPDPNGFIDFLNMLFEPKIRFALEDCERGCVEGKRFRVFIGGHEEGEDEHDHGHDHEHHHDHDHHHEHSSVDSINRIIDDLPLGFFPNVRGQIKAIYELLAAAESEAHGVPVSEVHFHEVGAMDAIADITAVCLAMDRLRPDRRIATHANVGSGHVHCAHGVLPVPAPATLNILRDREIPYYGSMVDGELLTPTGAALLGYFFDEYGQSPVIIAEKTAYGMGKRDYKDRVNGVRAVLGEELERGESITEIEFNVDDMTGEEMGYLTDKLLDSPAREVFTVPVSMKKNRPGVLYKVLLDRADEGEVLGIIFKHSSTIGVRVTDKTRHTLERNTYCFNSRSLGDEDVYVKTAKGFGVKKLKAEYDYAAEIADEKDMPLREVKEAIEKEWKETEVWKEL